MKRIYEATLKRHALDMFKISKSPTQVSEQLGIPKKTLEKWITRYKNDENVYTDGYLTDEEKIRKLENENKKLIETLEMLKKALAFLLSK